MTARASNLTPVDVFLSGRDIVHNPMERRHFMKAKPLSRRIRILRDGVLLAQSSDVLRLLEVGKDLYDPALYLPRDALIGEFSISGKTTHCPLKGDAEYLNLISDNGTVICENIAWFYSAPFEFAKVIENRVSFYTDQITIEDAPL